MASLQHANIVRLLGISDFSTQTSGFTNRPQTLAAVVEFMNFGNMQQTLPLCYPAGSDFRQMIMLCNQRQVSQWALQWLQKVRMEPSGQCRPEISCVALLYMASQLANALKYMEERNFVHRDVAARNFLLGDNFHVKISDFGLSRMTFQSDYYSAKGNLKLPIRWMARESLLYGKYSAKSDVWSFAVSLWEMFTLCREQPFSYLTDAEVIDNCVQMQCFKSSSQSGLLNEYLPQPLNCPKEVYDLMLSSWHVEQAERPSFSDIFTFLTRKSKDFNASEEFSALRSYLNNPWMK